MKIYIMPHVTHILVKKIVDNPNDYPKTIVARATQLNNWFEKKREVMKKMWKNRHIFHTWLEFMQLPKKNNYRSKRMNASLLMQQSYYGDDLDLHHEFQSHFRNTEVKTAFDLAMLQGALFAFECNDHTRMLTYAEAVNSATRLGEEYQDVGLMRWCDRNDFIEILLWKLNRETLK